MFLEYISPTWWITLAGGLHIIGFLLINQVYLRLAMLFGSLAYIAYYWTATELPLWGAIITSALMILANLIGLTSLFARNAAWAVPKDHADIYPHFAPLLPGDFRALVKRSKRFTLTQDITGTVQDTQPAKVYFVIKGSLTVIKSDAEFIVNGPAFVGEVAYLLGTPSSATTILHTGTEILEWSLPDLIRRGARFPRFKLALDSVISRDLAQKVSHAVSPQARLGTQSLGAPDQNHT